MPRGRLQTDPRFILPINTLVCPEPGCNSTHTIQWRLHEHMKSRHGWPRGFSQPHTEAITIGYLGSNRRNAHAAATNVDAESSEDESDDDDDEEEASDLKDTADTGVGKAPKKTTANPPSIYASRRDDWAIARITSMVPRLEASEDPLAPAWLVEMRFFLDDADNLVRVNALLPAGVATRLIALLKALEAFDNGKSLPQMRPVVVQASA